MAKKNKSSGSEILVWICTIPFLIVWYVVNKIIDSPLIAILITVILFVVVGGKLLSILLSKTNFTLNADIDHMEGHDFEYWCADLLRRSGFTQVKVTRGSGDQGVDITAYKDGKKYAIQCKRYNQKLGNKPVQEVHTGKTIYHCDVAVVMTNNYFTPSAVEAARATGVELWDREAIGRMMRCIVAAK